MFNIKAPAKINLCLKIQGKRPDGYHNLFNIMSFLDLSDIMTITEHRSVFPNVEMLGRYGNRFDNLQPSSIENNTIAKALDFMNSKYKTPMNFNIKTNKQIPIAGGLGGSSADAGAIIAFIKQYFNLNITKKGITDIAMNVGADIPFFTQNETALCEGVGEIMTEINFADDSTYLPVVIIYPHFSLNTGTMYSKLAGQYNPLSNTEVEDWKQYISNPELDFKELALKAMKIGNDFLHLAIQCRPEIYTIVNKFKECRNVLDANMSGSGSCCFAICETEEDANRVAIEMSSEFKLADVITTRLVPVFQREEILSTSRPAMGMIFHREEEEEGEWVKIK